MKKKKIKDLQSIGLRSTLPRKMILEIFESSKERHLSAQDVRSRLQEKGFDVGFATVYRVLTQFEECQIVLRHSFDNEKAYFELNNLSHHDHMVCIECGRVVEFTNDAIEKMQQETAHKHGMKLQSHALNLYVLCDGMAAGKACSYDEKS